MQNEEDEQIYTVTQKVIVSIISYLLCLLLIYLIYYFFFSGKSKTVGQSFEQDSIVISHS